MDTVLDLTMVAMTGVGFGVFTAWILGHIELPPMLWMLCGVNVGLCVAELVKDSTSVTAVVINGVLAVVLAVVAGAFRPRSGAEASRSSDKGLSDA